MNRSLYLLVLILLLFLSSAVSRDSDLDLEQLSRKKQELDSLLEVRQSAVEQVYLLEEQLSLTSRLIARLEKRQDRTQSEIEQLTGEIKNKKQAVARLKESLAINLRSFYMSYRPRPTLLVLAGDIHQAVRQAHYFKATVNGLKTNLDSIMAIQADLEGKQSRLNRINDETRELVRRKNLEESLLNMKRNQKQKLLTRIERDVDLKQQYLEETSENRRQLAELTEDLGSGVSKAEFPRMKGRLIRPVEGHIVQHFGRNYDNQTGTETFFPGIAIEVEVGTEVVASVSGKVAHADYLRGFGNMVILAHGEGWYTLYGHLSRIDVVRGEAVEAGDIIGLSGQSGSDVGPALFFGVRNREESFDPVEWLK